MSASPYAWVYKVTLFLAVIGSVLLLAPHFMSARYINEYKDTISNSGPTQASNHTLSFILNTTVNPGAYIEVIPPAGFEVLSGAFTPTENIELLVDGVSRTVGAVQSATDDYAEIFPGTPGMIRYTLNTTEGITAGSRVVLKIGNHTSLGEPLIYTFNQGTGTSTSPGDIKPIKNASDEGTYTVDVRVYDGGEVASAGFMIALVNTVGVGPADTTEEVPPFRFNGAPTGFIGGTTQSVEISLETDEFATCKYATTPGVAYSAMTNTFTTTGTLFHVRIIPVAPDTDYTFYVRCIDDELNVNPDDYLIEFQVLAIPTGVPGTTGSTTNTGTGSGTGTGGTGSGSGSGDTTSGSNGSGGNPGSTSGSGGTGGGGGGGSGGDRGSEGGGGFESADGPYRSGDGQVTITGYTAPRSAVTFLV
ncbi:MAG: hypothetical protein V4668_03205, partial [Patescibacteria group bacterium]